MLRARLEINTAPLEGLEAFVSSIEPIVKEVGTEAYDDIYPDFIDELQFYPPTIPGQKYKRTYKLRRGQTVTGQTDGEGVTLKYQNDVPYAPYVLGNVNFGSPEAGRKRQARIHRRRWIPVIDTLLFWFKAYETQFEKRLDERIGEFVNVSGSRRRNR